MSQSNASGRLRGYHGTSRTAAAQILRRGFRPSSNTYDWLGRGVYFWQDAPNRALEWANGLYPTEPAILAATIDLRDCLDLLDTGWQVMIESAYGDFVALMVRHGRSLPRQSSGAHDLDAAVLDYLVDILNEGGHIIRSIRAAFAEGTPFYPSSALFSRAHVQIAVRDHSAIMEIEVVEP